MIMRVALAMLLMSLGLNAHAREPATEADCQAAARSATVSAAAAAVERRPNDRKLQFSLADDWSAAGCFNNAVRVLEAAVQQAPRDKEAATRLRVAQSVVGEERYFENLSQVLNEASLKRSQFRCSSLADADACSDAARLSHGHGPVISSEASATGAPVGSNQTLAALAPATTAPPLKATIPDTEASRGPVMPADAGIDPKSADAIPVLSAHRPHSLSRFAHREGIPTSFPLMPTFSNVEPDSQAH